MSLIPDKETLVSKIGTIRNNLNWNSWEPAVKSAEAKHIIPYVSEAQYAELVTALAGSPNEHQTKVIGFLQNALAFYGLLEALPGINVQIKETGIMQPSAESAVPASRWSYHKAEEDAAIKGEYNLERALAYMEANSSEFLPWVASEAYTARKELLVNDLNTAQKWIDLGNSRRMFMSLRRYIRSVETIRVSPVISSALLAEIKAEIIAGNVSAVNQALIDQLTPALLHLALADALPHLTVRISGSGVHLITENDGLQSRLKPETGQIRSLQEYHLSRGEFYMNTATKFLYDNASDYPTFQSSESYQESESDQPHQPHDNTGAKSFMV